MAEQIPFDGMEELLPEDQEPIELSPAVEAIVTGEAFVDLSVDELVELAQCAIGEAVDALIEPLAEDEDEDEDEAIDHPADIVATVIAATQLKCAATILARVFEDEDEEG
jgi:predicted RecB family endonuclease